MAGGEIEVAPNLVTFYPKPYCELKGSGVQLNDMLGDTASVRKKWFSQLC